MLLVTALYYFGGLMPKNPLVYPHFDHASLAGMPNSLPVIAGPDYSAIVQSHAGYRIGWRETRDDGRRLRRAPGWSRKFVGYGCNGLCYNRSVADMNTVEFSADGAFAMHRALENLDLNVTFT